MNRDRGPAANAPAGRGGGSPVVACRGLNHFFGEGTLRRQVLYDIHLAIDPGEVVILSGPSGSGKSTLLALIGALHEVQQGQLQVTGIELAGLRSPQLLEVRRQIGYMFQGAELIPSLTVAENVAVALRYQRLSPTERRERIQELLGQLGLERYANNKPRELSGGSRQRVALARALANRPKLILADEPTAALSERTSQEVGKVFNQLADGGVTSLIVTHDNRLHPVADRIITLVDGRVGSNVPRSSGETATPEEARRSWSLPPSPGSTNLLTADAAFSSQTVILHYPTPIAIAYRRFCSRKEPRDRLAQLYDTFEATIEYLVCLGLSDLFACLARSGKTDAALPSHQGFDLTRRPTRMTVGQWVRTLRDTCDVLAKYSSEVFIPKLTEACGPTSYLHRVIFPWIIDHRNLATHTKGNIAFHSDECEQFLREDRPRLERLLQELQFIRHYPLGFVKPGFPVEGSPLKRYRVHSCMGARLAAGGEVFSIGTPAELVDGRPFIVSPDGSRLHYLWPFLLQKESDKTQQPSLYVFEGIAEGSQYLATISSAAIDHDHTWTQELCPGVAKGPNHQWVWDYLRQRPAIVAIDPELHLAEELAHSRVGKLAGETLGKHKLLRPIARGGFGTIYDAEDPAGKRVAVKVLEIEDGLDEEEYRKQFERFNREYRKLKSAGKRHPGIIECYDWGCDLLLRRDYPWYSMEFAAGGDLNSLIRERRIHLPPGTIVWDDPPLRQQVIKEFRAIAEAVSFLHEQDIIHRDIKPGNLLILDGGELRLSDFGLVKQVEGAGELVTQYTAGPGGSTQGGVFLGTLAYMAPEQALGKKASKAADVYSLGIVLAELATGYWPQPDPLVSAGSLIDNEHNRAHLDRLPEPLRRLILRCTDREPSGRPNNAREVFVAFERISSALAGERA